MKQVKGWAFPDCDEFMAGQLKADGTYQGTHLERAMTYISDWSAAFDGGAHVGTWSRLLAAKFARVVACEPSPDTFEALQANMLGFGCANVQCYQLALGDRKGRVSMTLDGRGAGLKNTGARYARQGGDIHQVTIDSFGLLSLGFLKLDVEGSEYAALAGACETLGRCRPIVLFENKNLWRRFGIRPDGPQGLLLAAGYKHLEKVGCDEIWGPA